LPNTLLKKIIWLLSVTADMSELPAIEARSVPLLHCRVALMIQRPPGVAVSAIMQVFASITGDDAESRASLLIRPAQFSFCRRPSPIISYLECGFAACPDNPVSYQLLKSTRRE
jgi:hypothetical protein